jgi:uncharacterized membrane protein YhaH (DUF805 family)
MHAAQAVHTLGDSPFADHSASIYGAIYLVVAIAMLWAWLRILRQAGYSGWYSLLALVPGVNVAMFFVFAFRDWPVRREVSLLRRTALRSDLSYVSYGPTIQNVRVHQ